MRQKTRRGKAKTKTTQYAFSISLRKKTQKLKAEKGEKAARNPKLKPHAQMIKSDGGVSG
jgi:hypothetical protein